MRRCEGFVPTNKTVIVKIAGTKQEVDYEGLEPPIDRLKVCCHSLTWLIVREKRAGREGIEPSIFGLTVQRTTDYATCPKEDIKYKDYRGRTPLKRGVRLLESASNGDWR